MISILILRFSFHGENRLAFSTLLICNYFSIVYEMNAGESIAFEYSRIPITHLDVLLMLQLSI